MAAVSCVPLTNVVGRGEPFQFTTVSLVKVVPGMAGVVAVAATGSFAFTVRVKPTGLQYGVEGICVVDAESDAMDIPRIENGRDGVEVPPPGAGLKTVTFAVPTVERSAGRIVVLIWVGPI